MKGSVPSPFPTPPLLYTTPPELATHIATSFLQENLEPLVFRSQEEACLEFS